MFLLFCGLFRCFRNGHKVTPFNVHPCGLRPAECKRHHPLVTPAYPGSLQGFRHLAGFLFLRTSPCGVPG